MGGLVYREDMDEVRKRVTTWWNGGDIGRPAMQITSPRERPVDAVPAMAEPEGWVTHYSTSDFDYRVNLAARACAGTHYLAEAVPTVAPDLAPNCLALFLGCKGVEGHGTVWCEPAMPKRDDGSPGEFVFGYDPANFYWNFCTRLAREELELGGGRFLLEFPDLIEGLDTLAALRGTDELLTDLIDRPEWVRSCLRKITDMYFHYYDILYDMMRDEVGGSSFWAWAPGRMAKFQCDFSAMISPAMFGEFMAPVLTEMTERVSYSMYHWDGPGALCHLDHLLSIPCLTMIQWTPGAGEPPPHDRTWWPYFHSVVEAGKKVICMSTGGREGLLALRDEFGEKLKRFMLREHVKSLAEADELIALASF